MFDFQLIVLRFEIPSGSPEHTQPKPQTQQGRGFGGNTAVAKLFDTVRH